jgi:DNA-binding ferritin-like protein (Dps family)
MLRATKSCLYLSYLNSRVIGNLNMANKNNVIVELYQKISQWIEDTKDNELTNIVDVVEQAKAYLIAAEAIPEREVKQFIDSFIYDLNEFYRQNQRQANNSLYLSLMNERFWQLLASMTDKSQVEWSELIEDFEHHGIYRVGDYIGFGELECQKCHQNLSITHLSMVSSCIECHGQKFIRHPMKP